MYEIYYVLSISIQYEALERAEGAPTWKDVALTWSEEVHLAEASPV